MLFIIQLKRKKERKWDIKSQFDDGQQANAAHVCSLPQSFQCQCSTFPLYTVP